MRSNLLLSISLALLAVVMFDSPVQASDSQDVQIVSILDSFQVPANLDKATIGRLNILSSQSQDVVAVVQYLCSMRPVAGLWETDMNAHNIFTVVGFASTLVTLPQEVELTRRYSNRAQGR